MTETTFDTTTSRAKPKPADDMLAALEAALAETVETPTVTVPVDARPGWAVRYRTNVSWAELQKWRKAATTGKKVDIAYLSRLILAGACVGFVRDGADAVLADGEPVTFGTVAKQHGCTVQEAVRVWLVTDGAINGTSDLVYVRSGYQMPDEADDDADPTGG